MFKQVNTDYISWIFLIGLISLIMELVFFDGGLIYTLALSIGCLFIGKKKYHRKMGKILFFIGVFSAVIIILNMFVFKFFLLVILAYALYGFYLSKQNPEKVQLMLTEPKQHTEEKEQLTKTGYLFSNKLIGSQQTQKSVYEWNNVNIQRGIGDVVIDLSNTILPKGETIISIRSMVGNLKIQIPYDVEVNLHHSVVIGRAVVFQNHEKRMYNQIISCQTQGFNKADQKVTIITSVFIGNIEVNRV